MRILLIHNRLNWHPITWLSLFIRVFTCSKWNHVAIESGGFVYESIGKGVIKTHYTAWRQRANRVVLPLYPDAEPALDLEPLVGQPYGFTDLLQIALHLVRTRWFAIGNSWNGKDGTLPGVFCSELVAQAIGIEKAHLMLPCEFEHLPGFRKGLEYHTYKN